MNVHVRSVDVGRVRVCMFCPCVNEYHRNDGEGVGLEDLVRLSYTGRYISLTVELARDWGML